MIGRVMLLGQINTLLAGPRVLSHTGVEHILNGLLFQVQIPQSIAIWDVEACLPDIPDPVTPTPNDCFYSEWEFDDCSVTCGKGFQIGSREVLQGRNCEGQLSAFRSCELEPCTLGMKL